MDEVLTPGWRDAIASQMEGFTRGYFMYVWNHLDDGSDGVQFWYDKIHTRHGYRWVNAVHEVLMPQQIQETGTHVLGFTLHHWADPSKSRTQYLPLLELAAKENPLDARSQHYYGRELMFHGHWQAAVVELEKHIMMPEATWDAERCASMRFIARCMKNLGMPNEAIEWQLHACAEAPNTREPWVELAQSMYETSDWPQCYAAVMNALKINDRAALYINEIDAWNWVPYDLAAISAFRMGMMSEAVKYGELAVAMKPGDDRLEQNLRWYREDVTPAESNVNISIDGKTQDDGGDSR
jgi:hypothetical protein